MCGHKAVYVGTQDPELIDVFVIHKVCDGGLTSAEKAVERVRELHKPIEDAGRLGIYNICKHCSELAEIAYKYPCETIKALDGEK